MSYFLRGYDAWKTREPNDDYTTCDKCGKPMRGHDKSGWYCEHCGAPDPEWEREP